MISVREAIDIALKNSPRMQAVDLDFQKACGRVLAEDVASDIDMPPFNRSMMDGYAIRAADATVPHRRLAVVGFIAAGAYPKFALGPGQAAKIMTGAPLPEGADAVREVEKTIEYEAGKTVEIVDPVSEGLNVVPQAAEVKKGQTVVTAGTYITPAVTGLLAAVGQTSVRVFRAPEVAILATGDELVAPKIKPLQGQIRNSNSFTLQALCRQMSLQTHVLGVAKDDPKTLKKKIEHGVQQDLLLITGGVSMGDLDYVDDILRDIGAKIYYDKVAIKPGKPTVYAHAQQTTIFALPGNPVSSATVFEVIVRPVIRKMMGYPVYQNAMVQATITEYFANKSGRENYHPAVTWYEDGRFFCRPLVTRGSGDLLNYSRSNSYLICPQETTQIMDGSEVEVLLRDDFYLT